MNEVASEVASRLSKLKIPAGSLFIDIGLVLILSYTAGQMTNRFEQMDKRLANLEQSQTSEKPSERIAILERRADEADKKSERDRIEILAYLQRIEARLNDKADKK